MSFRFGIPLFKLGFLRGQTPRPPDALATAVASAWLFHLRLDEVLKAVEFLLDALNAVYKHVLGQGMFTQRRKVCYKQV
jgi:hypothetical protein